MPPARPARAAPSAAGWMIMAIWPLGHGGTNPPARLAWPPPDRRVDGPALLRPARRPGSFVMVGATMTEEGGVGCTGLDGRVASLVMVGGPARPGAPGRAARPRGGWLPGRGGGGGDDQGGAAGLGDFAGRLPALPAQ